jgi:hypothetical protein
VSATQENEGAAGLAAPFILVPEIVKFCAQFPAQPSHASRVAKHVLDGGTPMKKTLAVLATVAAVGATTVVTAPAEARGIGPGLAFGLAAGAITAGALGAYGPGYGYYGYGPYYGGPAYGPGYAYYGGPYGGPYWRHRYWHRGYW